MYMATVYVIVLITKSGLLPLENAIPVVLLIITIIIEIEKGTRLYIFINNIIHIMYTDGVNSKPEVKVYRENRIILLVCRYF